MTTMVTTRRSLLGTFQLRSNVTVTEIDPDVTQMAVVAGIDVTRIDIVTETDVTRIVIVTGTGVLLIVTGASDVRKGIETRDHLVRLGTTTLTDEQRRHCPLHRSSTTSGCDIRKT